MARKKTTASSQKSLDTVDFRHTGEKRPNIPPAKMAAEGHVPRVPKAKYHYSPHLPPALRFDPTGAPDKLPELLAEAQKRPLTADEAKVLAEALRTQEPWLEWATKREQHEKGFFEVDPVALHIHERVSAQAIVRIAMREDVQRDLFADPQQPYREAVQFYKYPMDWANRLILGDSVHVMSSLARRESLAGRVQMIYMDPPYGIRFASNFQPEHGRRQVSEKDGDLTRDIETVRAFRDTWSLGVHSYLSYLRARLQCARELLSATGSIFVQISDENLHHVRELLDETFGPHNKIATIVFRKTTGKGEVGGLPQTVDYLLWYGRDKSATKAHPLYLPRDLKADENFRWIEDPATSERRRLRDTEDVLEASNRLRVFQPNPLTSQSGGATTTFDVHFAGQVYFPGKGGWKTNASGMKRLAAAGRLIGLGKTLRYVRYHDDFPLVPVIDVWDDTRQSGFGEEKVYVVQTAPRVIERCILLTTDPGDLVLDPTCGAGTTAVTAEAWGRRWITIDTSRVALSIARQRILTARFDHFRCLAPDQGAVSHGENPSSGFVYRTAPHITLKSIAQNPSLDRIFASHDQALDTALDGCNRALRAISKDERARGLAQLAEKTRAFGVRSLTDADRRRWSLPSSFEHWTVPFDVDSEWPTVLQDAVRAYRQASIARTEEVNACIAANAERKELFDQPERVKGIVRVSGPFTVEGVRPEELSLANDGLFDPTPNEFEPGDAPALENLNAYLTRMVQLIRQDGVTFLGNKHRKFERLEPLFEQSTGGLLHAEGSWAESESDLNTVAVAFGPQYGPVSALQVEEVIRSAKRYDELVIAGFSFDAEATAAIQESQHPKLRIHQAFIRPDVNPAMDGLLKDTANSQIFTVFGQPDVKVRKTKTGEFEVELAGVTIYDPIKNVVLGANADKVAAWFLDGDFDGRCFCITQAFFPDKKAWEKIAKALKSSADEEAFERLSGTVSLPFPAGKHSRIAVKVIDPRGNEVMAIHPLPA